MKIALLQTTLAAKEGFQTQLFINWVLTQPDFENPKKSISNLKKAISSLL